MVLQRINRTGFLTAAFFLILWVYTFLFTDDRENWLIENMLVFIFITWLFRSSNKPLFNPLSYLLIFSFLSLHVIGSMYAYASVPVGFELKDWFHLQRNPYDRIVHFSFGLLLAYPLQQVLLQVFNVRKWRFFIMPVEIILSVSALFELIEWFIGGVLMPHCANTYVGTQGDIWDAQKDMALATLGASITMLLTYLWRMSKQRSISIT